MRTSPIRGMRPSAAILAAALLVPAPARGGPEKLAGIGDSITQGYSANDSLGEHPDLSFGQGTDAGVNSVYLRFRAGNAAMAKEYVSVSGAEMVGGSDNAAAQAARICAQSPKPNRVVIELGGNDVCNRGRSSGDPTASLYSVTTFRNALKAALDTLGGCLPQDSVVQVLSMARVDFLYEAGKEKRSFYCPTAWYLASICRVVTAESDVNRRRLIGARIDAYNDGIKAEVAAAATRYAGKLRLFNDWQGPLSSKPGTSVGAYQFRGGDINGADCFHPYYTTGQKKLACVAWQSGEQGDPSKIPTTCLGN